MTYSICTPIVVAASLLSACAPKDDGDSDSDSDGDATSTSTTTGEPTTAAPTTDDPTSTTAAPTTGPGTTTSDALEPDACEGMAGPDGGEVEWYLRCGGLSHESVVGVGVDPKGDIYLGVDLRTLGPTNALQIGEFEVTPGELADILLIKLSSAGIPLWVRHFTGPLDQSIDNLVFCADGVAFTGYAEPGTLDLGGGVLADRDYIASFDADGNHRWSRSVPLLGDDAAHVIFGGLACDDAGTVALTGEFRDAIDLGGGPLAAQKAFEGFVAAFDATGALAWNNQFQATGDGHARGTSVAFTADGDLALTGYFTGTIDLGGGALTSDFEEDIVVARFDAAGGHLWSQQIGPFGLQFGRAVAVDSAGQVALGGVFLEEIEIGDDHYTNVNPDQMPEFDGQLHDGVLALLDPAGVPQWSKHIGTTATDDVFDLAFDADDALLLSGFTDERPVLRAFTGDEQTWEWSTDQLFLFHSALSGTDAVVVTAAVQEDVDFGAGPLTARGGQDLVVVRIRR